MCKIKIVNLTKYSKGLVSLLQLQFLQIRYNIHPNMPSDVQSRQIWVIKFLPLYFRSHHKQFAFKASEICLPLKPQKFDPPK